MSDASTPIDEYTLRDASKYLERAEEAELIDSFGDIGFTKWEYDFVLSLEQEDRPLTPKERTKIKEICEKWSHVEAAIIAFDKDD